MIMGEMESRFLETYDAHADAFLRFAYFGVHDRELAKDLVADMFARVWEYLANRNVVENIRALCYRTLRNLIVDHFRKHKSLSLDALAETGYEPRGADGREDVEKQDVLTELRQAITKLPGAFREVILLRYIEGYDPKEIAEMLNISQSLVSVRIFRGVKLLKQHVRT